MKINFPRILVLILMVSISVNGYSQEKKPIKDKIWANWILSSTLYVEMNCDTIPKPLSNWLLKTFYPYPKFISFYDSFNGSVLVFLDNNFKEELQNGKLYFIQKHFRIGCSNTDFYYVLDKSNKLTQISSNNAERIIWEKSEVLDLNFVEFEKKFQNYRDYEIIKNPKKLYLAYFIIVELNKGKVTQKIILK